LGPWVPLRWIDLTANFGTGSVHVYRFRLQAALQNGFGGTIPYRSTPLKANNHTLTFGLTFDL